MVVTTYFLFKSLNEPKLVYGLAVGQLQQPFLLSQLNDLHLMRQHLKIGTGN